MILFIPYLICLVGTSSALKVMTFNIWLSGAEVTNGMEKIAKQIQNVNPDVVALQIMAGEMPTTCTGRVQNMVQLVTNQNFINQISKSNVVPVIVAGDFNVPSDEDWTEANRAEHGGWAFEWPATKILRDSSGMKDSFRELHPDPLADPGITWSTVNKFEKEWDYTIPEPEDRIDFIFYRGPLRPTSSFPYAGTGPLTPIPHQWGNEWPSDHYAFITEFQDLPVSDDPVDPVKSVDRKYINRHGRDALRVATPQCNAEIIDGSEERQGRSLSLSGEGQHGSEVK